MIKDILVGIGGTPLSTAALDQAMDLALKHDARIKGVTLVREEALPAAGSDRVGAERLQQAIEHMKESCEEQELEYTIEKETGLPFEQLKDTWRTCDITVLGVRALFDLPILDDPEQEIHRLIVEGIRPIVAVEKSARPIQNALIAYNGSMTSAKAMKQFMQLRPWPDVEIEIATFDMSAAEADELLTAASDYLGAYDVNATTHQSEGDVREELLPLADSLDTDLIVLGDSARSLLTQNIFGDTAIKAMREADQTLFLTH